MKNYIKHHVVCKLQTEVPFAGSWHIFAAAPPFLHLRPVLSINLTEWSCCREGLIDSSGDKSPCVRIRNRRPFTAQQPMAFRNLDVIPCWAGLAKE